MSFVTHLKTVPCLLVLALLVAGPVGAQLPTRNILFIAVDDLRNWVTYAGEGHAGQDIHGHSVHTPSIDALAAVSTRYRSAYTTMPRCEGSRTSVMFGLSPATHGLTMPLLADADPRYKAVYDDPNLTTIPEVLSANGYYSAAAGKIFHFQLPERWDTTGPPIDLSVFGNLWMPGPDGTFFHPGVLDPNEVHLDQTVATWGVEFLNGYTASQAGIDGKPFFLALGFYQPHVPWRVHQAYYDLYPIEQVVAPTAIPGDLDDVPTKGVELANSPQYFTGFNQYQAVMNAGKEVEYTRAYLAAISHTDAMIGQVWNALQSNGYAGNTDVILWSDHGYHLGEKFHWRKLTFWEQSTRVPLLVSSPGNANYPPGDVFEEVSLLDIAATVLDLAGVDPEPQFEGAPLHDALNRSQAKIWINDGVATVANGFKDIDYDVNVPGNADKSRYDLTVDPDEEHNLSPGC